MFEKLPQAVKKKYMYEILPQDLMYEIQLRLPVKSIGQFRCVSKAWRSLLSERQFAKLHHLRGPEHIIVHSLHSTKVLSLTSKTHGLSRDTGFETRTMMLGSCHGLVLLGRRSNYGFANLVLKNPITLESHQILCDVCKCEDTYGLAYDSSADDYKIALLQSNGSLHVYSVRTQTWRILGKSAYRGYSSHGMLLNGRLHWFTIKTEGRSYLEVIASFNLATEEFEEIPYPRGFLNGLRWEQQQLIVLGGCLAIVCKITSTSYDVWLMNDYGVQDSWTKFTINSPGECFKPVCTLDEDEIFLLESGHGRKSALYNSTSGATRDLVLDGTIPHSIWVRTCISFRESLVSPNYK